MTSASRCRKRPRSTPTSRRPRPRVPGPERRLSVEADRSEQAHARPRQQDFILLERRAVADVVVEQVLALEADGHCGHDLTVAFAGYRVAQLRIKEIVAARRRLMRADLVLAERMQQVDPREPGCIAIEEAGAESVRRNAGDVLVSLESGAGKVVLPFDAPGAIPYLRH